MTVLSRVTFWAIVITVRDYEGHSSYFTDNHMSHLGIAACTVLLISSPKI